MVSVICSDICRITAAKFVWSRAEAYLTLLKFKLNVRYKLFCLLLNYCTTHPFYRIETQVTLKRDQKNDSNTFEKTFLNRSSKTRLVRISEILQDRTHKKTTFAKTINKVLQAMLWHKMGEHTDSNCKHLVEGTESFCSQKGEEKYKALKFGLKKVYVTFTAVEQTVSNTT